MKKRTIKPTLFERTFSSKILANISLMLIAIMSVSKVLAQPTHDWKKVDWRDKDITNASGLSQALSGDEWWYSHKNLYDPIIPTKQIGYIAVGYIADIVHPGDEQKMRDAFNEGSDGTYNRYSTVSTDFFSYPSPYAGYPEFCYDFIQAGYTDGTVTVNASELRTPFRGMVATLDMNGNMLWCRLPNISGGGLQEVIQDGDYIYVIGTHDGVKTTKIPTTVGGTNLKTFIPYNPTSVPTETSNIFSTNGIISPTLSGSFHMYVAKFKLDGTKLWERLYGATDFSVSADAAYSNWSVGNDLILNSDDSLLYAVGSVKTPTVTGTQPIFVAQIDPSTGYLLTYSLLPLPIETNMDSHSFKYVEGRSICEIGTSGKMAVAGMASFDPVSPFKDFHRGIVYSINQDLTINTNWAVNPRTFSATSGNSQSSNIWEINYHSANQEVLVGLMTNCDFCFNTSNPQSAVGEGWRLAAADGSLVTGNNPLAVGNINAFDLRVGIIETSDGGYATVSSKTHGSPSPPTVADLGTFTTCISTSTFVPYWDSDPVIAKYDNLGNKLWEWSEDVIPGRSRVPSPGDVKRQECMYKISEAWDKSLVISGNCSFNHDDDYMVKLHSDCQNYNPAITYDIYPHAVTSNTTWTSSHFVAGQVTVTPGNTLTIDAATIKFSYSGALGQPCGIVVMPGAKLDVINGSLLTSIDNSVCPGSMWDGIIAVGTNSNQGSGTSNYNVIPNQGIVSINSSTISNAVRAVVNCSPGILSAAGYIGTPNGPGGGVIRGDNAYFINNQTDIECWDYYGNANKTVFNNCHFLINDELNNHYNPVQRVFIQGVRGVNFNGCEFAYNAGSAYGIHNRGFGIQSNNSVFTVQDGPGSTQSLFTNLTCAIQANNTTPLQTLKIDHAIFNNTFSGDGGDYTSPIVLISPYMAQVSRNAITTSDYNSEGIYLANCKYYSVSNNTITQNAPGGSSAGIRISYSGGGAHKAYRNNINGFVGGIVPQYANSASYSNSGNPSDGLLINCNTFSDNYMDIAMLGPSTSSNVLDLPSVRQNQGIIDQFTSPTPTLLVRNRYDASCGLDNKWWIDAGTKNIKHAANSDVVCMPSYTPGCSNPLVQLFNSGAPLNYTLDCKENETSAPSGTLAPSPATRLYDINTGLGVAIDKVSSLAAAYTSTVDGGNTLALLGVIDDTLMSSYDRRAELSAYSPYLSDEVLLYFFNKPGIDNTDMIALHSENSPVSEEVWDLLQTVSFSGAEFETLEENQGANPVSPRRAMEDELGHARSELQFVCAEKLNYFLRDTLKAAPDSVIAILSGNIGNMHDAVTLRLNAYAHANNYERAFAFADSLAVIPEYDELMVLEKTILKLDTAKRGHSKILIDPDLNDIIVTYAKDPGKEGSWLARAIMYEVYGTKIDLPRLPFPEPEEGERKMYTATSPLNQKKNNVTSEESYLKIYPNPTDNSFHLLYGSANETEMVYSVCDLLGKEILSGTLRPNVTTEINSSMFKNGIYFISLIQGSKLLEKKKLIIMR